MRDRATVVLTVEEKLDQALEGTFPASDAFCLVPDEAAARENLEQIGVEKPKLSGDRRS